jgi:hypothetical protein
MWESLFSDVSFNKTLEHVRNGVNGAVKVLTSLNFSPPPPPVETSIKLGNDGLIKNGLSRLYPELEESIFIESHHRETTLISNFIKDPKTYLYLSSSENKLATTKAIIKDIEGLEKDGRKIPQNIKKIITDHKKNSSIITAEELKPLSDFYIQLADKTIVDKTDTSFSNTDTKSKPQNKPLQTPNHSTHSPAVPLRNPTPSHTARTRWDHQQKTVGRASTSRRADPQSSSRVSSMTRSDDGVVKHVATTPMSRTPSHPASIKPQTNLPTQPEQTQKPLTGKDVRYATLKKGATPTNFKSGDATRAENEGLENYGKELAKLEYELNLIKEKAGNLSKEKAGNLSKEKEGNLSKEKNNTKSGTHNPSATNKHNNAATNIRNEIKTLNENLYNAYFYTPSKITIVNNAKKIELDRLKNIPSVRPSAAIVVTKLTQSHLLR